MNKILHSLNKIVDYIFICDVYIINDLELRGNYFLAKKKYEKFRIFWQ